MNFDPFMKVGTANFIRLQEPESLCDALISHLCSSILKATPHLPLFPTTPTMVDEMELGKGDDMRSTIVLQVQIGV